MLLYNRDINSPEQAPGRPRPPPACVEPHQTCRKRPLQSGYAPRHEKLKKPSKFLPVKTSFHANERWPEMLPHRRIPPVTDGELCCLDSVYLLSLCVILFPNLEKPPQSEQEQRLMRGWLCATDAAKGKNSVKTPPTPPTWLQEGNCWLKDGDGIKVVFDGKANKNINTDCSRKPRRSKIIPLNDL